MTFRNYILAHAVLNTQYCRVDVAVHGWQRANVEFGVCENSST